MAACGYAKTPRHKGTKERRYGILDADEMRVLDLCALTLGLFLAQRPPQVFTLDRVIDIAIESSELIRAGEADLEQTEGERRRARSGLFPQLTASAGYQRTLATEFSSLFRRPGVTENTETEELDLPFGRTNIWQLDLSLSQNIFSGGRIGALQDLARASRKLASTNLRTIHGQVEFLAAEAFYEAALQDHLVAIAESTVRQAEQTIRHVEAGFRAGTQPEFEVLRARVDRDIQIPLLNRARTDRDIAYLRLKQLLELPDDEPLVLMAGLDSDRLEIPSRYASGFTQIEQRLKDKSATIQRAALDSALALVERQQANLNAVEADARPNIAAISNYANVTYPTNVFSGFSGIRTNWTAGVNVTLPLLTGGRQRGNEIIARAQLQAQRAQYALAEELADVDTRSAWAEVSAAKSTWEASSSTVIMARRAYEIADIRFRSGVSTQLELSDARLQLELAEARYIQAARDLQVARIRVALLPILPLTTAPAATALSPAVPSIAAEPVTVGMPETTAPFPGRPRDRR
jgi:outer membrane protein TolC